MRVGVCLRKLDNSLRVGVPKAVDRLVLIAYDSDISVSAYSINQNLIGFIQVLILVNNDVIVARRVRVSRILLNEIKR